MVNNSHLESDRLNLSKYFIKGDLKPGNIVDIYTDYKECEGYEGKAKLLKRIGYGDSFYLRDEAVKVTDKKLYSNTEISKQSKYSNMFGAFFGREGQRVTKEYKRVWKELCALRKDNTSDFKNMNEYLNNLREELKTSTKSIRRLLDYSNDYIIRFVCQYRKYNDWTPTIFASERWQVEFIEDHTGWAVNNFITNRNIRIIRCVNPDEKVRNSEVLKYTTYNGKNSIQQAKDEEREYTDEELELLETDLDLELDETIDETDIINKQLNNHNDYL